MDKEDRERLKKVLDLSERNNKMIRKLYSAMKWGRALKAFYWLVIIGVAIGAFYFIQPAVDSVKDLYGSLQGGVESIRGNFQEVEDLKDSLPENL